jgi:glycosyltransferase involved in cell wall biosynthesis
LTDEEIRDLYRRATAVMLPGEEDFGLVPVEAQACGCPVVALARGGAVESVVDGKTGVLVDESSISAFADGLRRIQAMRVEIPVLRAHAERFSTDTFTRGMTAALDELLH